MGQLKAPIDERSVHLCIDMQRLFTAAGPWPTPWMKRVAPLVASLVAKRPERTIFTRFIPPRTPDDASGMWRPYYRKWECATLAKLDPALLELIPELAPYALPAHVFDKPVYSAFSTGALHPFLREKDISTLIITGAETDVCVLATVLSAVDLGYRIILVQDGLCSSSDEAHDALTNLYAKRFDIQIELADMASILESWRV
jgi:nicotinamidase-related amidase